ncbi:MAG: bifunctional folylpolyglutamate synthase/dihydrofolate synthase, partial [Desulfarculus sp.]|nr:bifunctional folylpolyglutamate synthase/dihydrofolate synthase [Desulfarculus sp.]
MDHYQAALDRLYDLQKHGIKLGLSSTANMLEKLGNPHLGLKCLHLAGTNGKGSVGAMLEATLLAAGLQTGFYTSPHLVRFSERFRLNGQEISPERVLELIETVWPAVDEREPPTFFEFVTAMAFVYFAQEGADWTILETGMGGRLDATNLCRPQVTVITNIGLEHQEYLGHTYAAIAWEKAGIIKAGIPLVHGVTQPAARLIVEGRAAELGAPLHRLGREITCRRHASGTFSLKGGLWDLKDLRTSLVGRHQPKNAALAL